MDINLRATKNTTTHLQKVAEKLADNFVRIAGKPANSFVIIVNVGSNAVEDEPPEFSAFPKP